MATGKVYFWDSATVEVAWEPPAGAQPRSKHDNAATFAAHVSAADSPTAGVSGTAAVASDLAAPVVTGVLEVQFPEAAGTENAADAKQAGSTSEGSPAHTGAPSTTEDQEEGQLAEVRSASRSPPVEAPLVHLLPPDIQLGTLGQQVVDQIRSSTHTLCRNIPQLVRLAVEAEIRLEDWHMFSTKQQQAVDSSQAETAVSWTDVQDHLRWRWQSINAALPAAVQEAQQLHARMDQELEAGEMPPLPCEDAVAAAADAVQLPPNQTAMSVDAADPVATLDSAHLGASAAVSDPALSDASGFGEGVGLADPSEAPPLPAEDPESIPMAVSVANAVSSTNGGAGAADDDTDMELDMEVDDNSGASRPASAESTGQDAAAASGAALPDWAGYYMAHGYRYPYYGKACSFCTCQACVVSTCDTFLSSVCYLLALMKEKVGCVVRLKECIFFVPPIFCISPADILTSSPGF